jgi:hypothetical protein
MATYKGFPLAVQQQQQRDNRPESFDIASFAGPMQEERACTGGCCFIWEMSTEYTLNKD